MRFNDYISNIFAAVSGVLGLIVAYPIFHDRIGLFIVALISSILGYTHGVKMLSGLGGTTLRIWLITGSIGIDFLDLAIRIFQTDKLVSKDEIKRIKIYMTQEFGSEIGIEAENYIAKNYKKRINIKRVCNNYIDMKHAYRLNLFHQLFGISTSNGSITEKEDYLLKVIAFHLKIGKRGYEYVKKSFVKETKEEKRKQGKEKTSFDEKSKKKQNFVDNFFSQSINAYIILGVDKNANLSEVKKAYRRLVKLYHPDMIKGKSVLYKEKAKEKFNEINESYNYLQKQLKK